MSETLNVLFVEDDLLARWTGRKRLEKLGCYVSEAGTCSEAEATWKTDDFDLVVMDYRLPDGFGIEAVERMRKLNYNQHVICLTAEAECISDAQQHELGISAVLSKPLNMNALKDAVANIKNFCRGSDSHGNTGKKENVESESDLQYPGRIGRFEVVKCPVSVNENVVREIAAQHDGAAWLALDMRKTSKIDDIASSILLHMADEHRQADSRLCLVGLSKKLMRHFNELGIDRSIDIVEDIDGLEPLGRRLTSVCERIAVLDSVID